MTKPISIETVGLGGWAGHSSRRRLHAAAHGLLQARCSNCEFVSKGRVVSLHMSCDGMVIPEAKRGEIDCPRCSYALHWSRVGTNLTDNSNTSEDEE